MCMVYICYWSKKKKKEREKPFEENNITKQEEENQLNQIHLYASSYHKQSPDRLTQHNQASA